MSTHSHGGDGGHGHGGDGGDKGHGHSCGSSCDGAHEPLERGVEYGLWRRIDVDRLQCLNESRDGAGRTVFKPWDRRTDRCDYVQSDCDQELLFNVPFSGSVKLKGIIVSGEDDESHPAEVRLYKNVPGMSFDDAAEREPDQVFGLNRDPLAELEYPTKVVRFADVRDLAIHVSANFGEETTRVYYIGLKGQYSEARRHQVTICNYEASANPADHRAESIVPQTHFIS